MNTIYSVMILVLILNAIIFYLIGAKTAKSKTIALELANQDLNRLKSESEINKQELENLNNSHSVLKTSLEKYKTYTESLKSNHRELQKNQQTIQKSSNFYQAHYNQLKIKESRLEVNLTHSTKRLNSHKEKIVELNKKHEEHNQELFKIKDKYFNTKAEYKSILQERDTLKTRVKTLQEIEKEYTNNKQKYVALESEMQTKQKHFDEQVKIIQESRSLLKKEFENLANTILEKKSKAFKQLNMESINTVLNPIHQELKGFKNKVNEIHQKDTEDRIKLRSELENLQKLNKDITEQAKNLTIALKGDKKVQGNWGELMLENVLDSSGLRLGKDYKREVSFNSEEGQLRPDVVIYLPQNKHLVIDAKTSLNAYTTYVNSSSSNERKVAIQAHTAAVKSRLIELSNKEYSKISAINSPEVVIMFIPIESAYIEAIKADESLFQLALDKNILITTPTTLLTSLNIVRQLWRFEEQNKHTAELASRAELFYKKLNNFLNSMKNIGGQLDKAKDSYNKAFGQLYSGRGNLIKQASEFKELGVSVQNELPKDLLEKANLELGEEMGDNKN